ncbi:MAG TPA: chain length determinant protein EpsF [Steroidobacteraceae bacterium]|nr:chain length determinant protein EpsF [Steroidobacteraceae bacterium]
MSLRQFLLVLRARWKLAFGVFSSVVLATIIVSLLMPKMYTADATVVVDMKPDPLTTAAYSALNSTAYIATQVDIISSERVADRVAKILKLDKSPEYLSAWKDATGGKGDIVVWIGQMLQKSVVVTPSRDSSVIDISMTWSDPKTAAVLANAFAQAYIDTNIELKVDPAKQYATWFDERSRALRADLEAKQKRLSDYEAETGIVASNDGRLDVENQRLNELTSQLLTIQALRQDSQSRQRQGGSDIASMSEVLQSPYIAGLKADLSKAEANLQNIATNVGKNHPDYKNAAAEVASIRARLESETARIMASFGTTAQVNLRRENEIRAALDAQKKRMLDLTHEHDQLTVLQNDVATAQRNLDAVTQRLAQSSLESQTQQTNVYMLTTAVEPMKKSSPRYLINLLVGIFLGGVLGLSAALFRELSDRRIREDVDLLAAAGVPLFAKIPGIKPDGRSPSRAGYPVQSRVEPSPI